MARRIAVLVLAANPTDTPSLRLDQEVRELQSGLLRASRKGFHIRQDWAVRPRDLRRALLEHRPKIVHFCGHGTGEEGLVLEDDHNSSHLASTSALASLFELFSSHVECVVLNACYSDRQAAAISAHVTYVVGMSRAISDDAAIEFAVGFYDAIAAGETFERAFAFGRNAIELAGLEGHATPTLIGKGTRPLPDTADQTAPPRGVTECSPSRGDGLRICSLPLLRTFGWSTAQVMRRLEQIDYGNLAGLDTPAAGTTEQWMQVAEANPDGYAFLVDAASQIVGYWHFEALPDHLYNRARQGELDDIEVTVDNVVLPCVPGWLDLYFIIFVVEHRYRGFLANRLLFDAFLDRVAQLAALGIELRRVCANAITPEGVGLCRTMGLTYLQPHCRSGLMFEADLRNSRLLKRTGHHARVDQ